MENELTQSVNTSPSLDWIKVRVGTQKVSFRVTKLYTFGQLKEDSCDHWRLNAVLCDLVDESGHHWPPRGNVRDALESFPNLRVWIAARPGEDALFSSRFGLRADSAQPLQPPQSSGVTHEAFGMFSLVEDVHHHKSPVVLKFYVADPSETARPVTLTLPSGKICCPVQEGMKKSTKISWERGPHRVLFVKKPGNKDVLAYASMVGQWLTSRGLEVCVEDDAEGPLAHFPSLETKLKDVDPAAEPGDIIDLVLTFGGDGTVLHAASIFKKSVPPIISFNLGSLGFLTRLQVSNFKQDLSALLAGEMFVLLRSRLLCRVFKRPVHQLQSSGSNAAAGGAPIFPVGWEKVAEHQVLNEVVIDKGGSANLTLLDTFCDGVYITTVQADGVIVASTTGTTAYSLSCGGTMVHPSVPAIAFTPICPHSLSFRPVIFPAHAELRIMNGKTARNPAYVSFDGHSKMELQGDDVVEISMSQWPVPCVGNTDNTSAWFSSLAECLHWNDRKLQGGNDTNSGVAASPKSPSFFN